jgi:uncharacterized membrane protein YphA (DoxX/SURF4 family)
MTSTLSKYLNIFLWLSQIVLAAMFLMSGGMKVLAPMEEIERNLPWAAEMPGLIKFIGFSEILGALGLVVPAMFRILPILTPFAAIGLFAIMLLAAGFHFKRSENDAITMNAILAAVALFIAWGRLRLAPISKK